MMTNKYQGKCAVCKRRVDAGGGYCERVRSVGRGGRWRVLCAEHGKPVAVARGYERNHSGYGEHLRRKSLEPGVAAVLSSGHVIYQNSRGRCEDAPCCGCCN